MPAFFLSPSCDHAFERPAAQAQTPPASRQRQALPHAQAGASAGCGVVPWQPQVQPLPGQVVQPQRVVSMEFMAFLSDGVEPGGFVRNDSPEATRRGLERNG